jgi:predicted nucleic acid-binding protein
MADKPSVYVETSIVSYLAARDSPSLVGAARQLLTRRWWEKRDGFRLFVSDIVLRECRAGDPVAALRRLDSLRGLPSLVTTERCADIAEALIARKILPPKAAEDALHVAVATVHGMDILLTWNCKHIANPIMQTEIAGYLEIIGLSLPFICTPEELLGEEDA